MDGSREAAARAAAQLPPLVPYMPPLARNAESCVCGWVGPRPEEILCSRCRYRAVGQHGERLAGLLSRITYDHRGVRLSWASPDADPTAFTPRVRFTAADVHDPHGPDVCFGWFADWADDQLIAACAAGADDTTVLALAVAQAHYAVATLAIHEVGEWFTYRGRQVYPPHRPDPYLPGDEDSGPDGNGQIVVWLTYNQKSQPAETSDRALECPVSAEEIGTLPGQDLQLTPNGISVIPPQSSRSVVTAWRAPRAGENGLQRTLRDVHYAMVMSELAVVATHLKVAGTPVFAADGTGIATTARLTYDG